MTTYINASKTYTLSQKRLKHNINVLYNVSKSPTNISHSVMYLLCGRSMATPHFERLTTLFLLAPARRHSAPPGAALEPLPLGRGPAALEYIRNI